MSMDVIESLAAQLRAKSETHIITLDEVENLIKNRHIAQLQALFSDERQKEQAYKPFYQYDKKGRRQVGDERIAYKNHEYLVVVATKGWREPSKAARKYYDAQAGFYHSAWVFGIADGNPWIHRLEWDDNFENDAFEWTREYILTKMHFSASVDEITSFEKGQVIRLQGDLTTQKTQTLQEYKESLKNNYLYAERNQFYNNFEKVALEANKTEIDTRKGEIEADAKLAESLDKSEKTKAEANTLRDLKKKYGITARTRIDSTIRSNKYAVDAEILRREKDKQGYDTLLANQLIKAEKTFDEDFMKLQTKQVNVRLGNHLIVVERAKITRNNEVVVLEDSQCYIIHDEHENRIVTLDAGMYRFGLLARHITDRR